MEPRTFLDLLRNRRSIRCYKDRDIDQRSIEQLKEALLRSPSSRDIKPWRFIFITDRDILGRLSRSKESGSQFLRGARLGVVVCALEKESDVWIEDCSIASIILQLAALSLGIGSCWIQIRNRMHDHNTTSEEYVRSTLGLGKDHRVESIISLGYPDEELPPVLWDDLDHHKVVIGG